MIEDTLTATLAQFGQHAPTLTMSWQRSTTASASTVDIGSCIEPAGPSRPPQPSPRSCLPRVLIDGRDGAPREPAGGNSVPAAPYVFQRPTPQGQACRRSTSASYE